jgi:cell division septal protein FtsQ
MSPASAPARKPARRKATARKSQTRKPQARKPPARSKTTARRAPARSARRRPTARRPALRRRLAPSRGAGRLSWRRRLLGLLALVLAIAGGYLFWFRDSSLVAVTDVEVVGVTTSDRPEVVGALTGAAEEMTTLHVDSKQLESIAARFPTVAGIDIDPNFPHGMRIEVRQRPPRVFAEAGGDPVPVAADGTVLAGVTVPEDLNLPVLELDQVPATTLEGEPLAQAQVAGAAPDPLLGLIEKIGYSQDFGVELTMRGGIAIRFGTAERADDKWAAAAAVLADPKLDAATYVDVRVPERPVAGGAA